MDDYGSHLPTLRMVMRLVKPKRVLELGAGTHSTPFFLAAGGKLTTLETDETWFMKAEEYGDFDLRLVEDTVEALPPLESYDLIFIDNADNPTDRIRAIRAVLGQEHPVTVIHDAEVYGSVINELTEDYMVCDSDTAVCW